MNLRLLPAGPVHFSEIIEAMDESGDDIYQAMPWLELEEPIPSQVEEYLQEVQRYGAGGLSYHWAVEVNANIGKLKLL